MTRGRSSRRTRGAAKSPSARLHVADLLVDDGRVRHFREVREIGGRPRCRLTWELIERGVRWITPGAAYLIITPGDDQDLFSVAAAKDGRYYCTHWCVAEGQEYVTFDPRGSTKPVDLYLGPPNARPARLLVDLETAVAATKAFALRGERDPALRWRTIDEAWPA